MQLFIGHGRGFVDRRRYLDELVAETEPRKIHRHDTPPGGHKQRYNTAVHVGPREFPVDEQYGSCTAIMVATKVALRVEACT